jgi:hypothetical protein
VGPYTNPADSSAKTPTDSAGGGYVNADSVRSPAAKKLSGSAGTGGAQDTSHR